LRPTDLRDPTRESFRRLLIWLDAGDDSRGERYLEMRRRLVGYFERKRCDLPDTLADETLNRVARRLSEEGTIQGAPAQYCYIVARFVFHEHLRDSAKRKAAAAEQSRPLTVNRTPSAHDSDADVSEQLLMCLDGCLDRLPGSDRELIVEYYRGERRQRIERRKQIAAGLGVTANALMIRASRIRVRLELCVNDCCGQDRPTSISSQ
jgi:DNA-directed RNA polymerase specialized sigma24 family protein